MIRSLRGKLLLSTAVAITLLFTVTGFIVQDHAARLTALSLEEEVQTGFRAYEALWQSRAGMLSTVSLLLSRMPDVRAAFSTGDAATIRDTAGEIWRSVAREDAVFLVCDPRGRVIASLGRPLRFPVRTLPFVERARSRFPRQVSGFLMLGDVLYQTALTPVYVSGAQEPALINVLVAGYAVDNAVAGRLEESLSGTRFRFLAGGRTVAASPDGSAAPDPAFVREISRPLLDIDSRPIGELRIARSFAGAQLSVRRLRRDIFLIWAGALLAALLLISALARRILSPLAELDAAAQQIARGNFEFALQPGSADEIGRLARTFDSMRHSLKEARDELIRQERLSTIGRLSASLVHDLRNPLAAIYGGAELLMDSALTPEQVRRLSANIYRSSRRIQELLHDLVEVSRGGALQTERCRVTDLVQAALADCRELIERHHTHIETAIEPELEVPAARARIERVMLNLIANAVEAMGEGGVLRILAASEACRAVIHFEDSGPGVAPDIRARLFEPFATSGKRGGLGLGLALSRKTVLDHGGDLWLEPSARGARFCLALPLA